MSWNWTQTGNFFFDAISERLPICQCQNSDISWRLFILFRKVRNDCRRSLPNNIMQLGDSKCINCRCFQRFIYFRNILNWVLKFLGNVLSNVFRRLCAYLCAWVPVVQFHHEFAGNLPLFLIFILNLSWEVKYMCCYCKTGPEPDRGVSCVELEQLVIICVYRVNCKTRKTWQE
jgi:hypothetical protein